MLKCVHGQSTICPACGEHYWPSCSESFKSGAHFERARTFKINKDIELQGVDASCAFLSRIDAQGEAYARMIRNYFNIESKLSSGSEEK